MLHRMAVRGLQRELPVALTLGTLILLSVVLAAAGTGLLTRLVGASEGLLERARAPHLAQMHAGDLDPEQIVSWAQERREVTAVQIQPQLLIDGDDLLLDGTSQAGSIQQNSLVVPESERDLLLDPDGGAVRQIEPGTIWLPVYYEIEHGLRIGDTVTVTGPEGYRIDLSVAGFMRDAIMNTAVASSKRLAVSAQDHAAIAAHTGTLEHLIGFWVDDARSQVPSLRTAYQEAGMPAAGPMVDRTAFSLFNLISEGLVAAVVLLVAAAVLVVALLCLRLALVTAMARETRENGVMLAIGVPVSSIVRLQLLKNAAIAVPASLLGLLGGWALAPALTGSLTRYLGVSAGAMAWIAPALTSLGLLCLVLATVAVVSRRLRRISAVAALRRGATGSGRGPGRLRLHRSPLPAGITLGLMDLTRRLGMHSLLLVVIAVCALIVTVPAATSGTLRSAQFPAAMGVGSADLRMDLQHTGPGSGEAFAAAQHALARDGEVIDHVALTTTRHLITDAEGTPLALPVDNGDHRALPVDYAEGRAPRDPGEIALSLIALLESGTEVGQTLRMQVRGQPRELTVVGAYQDITHGGLTAKAMLPAQGEEVIRYVLSARLEPGVDTGAAVERLSSQLPEVKIVEIDTYLEQILGPLAAAVTRVAVAATAASVLLGAVITGMFVQMLRAGSAGGDGIQRALGASRAQLDAQYLSCTLIVSLLGAGLGVLAGLAVGQGVLNLMIEGMLGGIDHLFQGASRIDLVADPVLTAAGIPLLLATVTVAVTALTVRSTPEPRISALTTE